MSLTELNELEEEEFKNEGSFVCSNCIQKEMDEENRRIAK
jgi:hypothetical protein